MGSSLWFQLHRVFMVCSTILVALAFVVILVEAKGWNTEMGAHPILGMLVIILVCFQAIAGFARPAIGSARRRCFALVHRYSGLLSYLLASITIFLGLAALEVGISAMVICLVIVVTTVVGMEARAFYRARTVSEIHYREEDFERPEMDSEEPIGPDSKEILVRKVMSLFIACVAFGLAFLMIGLVSKKAHFYLSKAKSTP